MRLKSTLLSAKPEHNYITAFTTTIDTEIKQPPPCYSPPKEIHIRKKYLKQQEITFQLRNKYSLAHFLTDIGNVYYDTYDILPKGANADLMSSVVISGLKSPTNTWK